MRGRNKEVVCNMIQRSLELLFALELDAEEDVSYYIVVDDAAVGIALPEKADTSC